MHFSRCFTKLMISCGTVGLLLSPVLRAAEEPITSVDGFVEWNVSNDSGSELQLEVRQMPLERVLSTLATKTGIPIHYSILPEGLVTATCVGSTLQGVMECLLARKADLIVRRKQPDQAQANRSNREQPAEIWVLGSRYSNSASCSDFSVSQRAINNAPVKTLTSQVDAQIDAAEPASTEDWLAMTKSKDASVRANAIGALMTAGTVGDANVKRVLEEALTDSDASVRAQAISSLAHREGIAATPALQDALHDSDAGVRLMAVDGAANDESLLRQAVNDDDETVRNLAISKLEELKK